MTNALGFTTRPEIAGTFGVVASTHWIASQVGMAVLEKGGNAFDAAVAAGFVLQVVEPHMNGPGGDAVILARRAGADRPDVICGQGPAPSGATLAHYRGEGLDLAPGAGLLAAVVPGAIDAWLVMLRDYGTMAIEDLLAPAIGYAREGYPLVAGICKAIAGVAELFANEWPSSARLYLQGGRAPAPGSLFRNPELATTYEALAAAARAAGGDRERRIEAARRAFHDGAIAEAIERFAVNTVAMDSSGRRHRGVLRASDLAAWRASIEPPVEYTYRATTVFKPGPWSQGPVLLQLLALLKGFDIAAMDTLGADFVHTLVEAKKLAYADREAWYADPRFVDVPLNTLLSDAYNAERRRAITHQAASGLRPGAPDGRAPRLPKFGLGPLHAAGIGEPTRIERESQGSPTALGPREGDTCHLDVIDRHGNIVAATPSGGWLQSSPAVPGLGFCLGTRLQMFWLDEASVSCLAPGRRPRTTLTPSMARQDGRWTAFGSPGGDNQDQWIAQFLLRHVDHGLNLQAAIDAPMLQSDHMPNSFFPRRMMPGRLIVESRFPRTTIDELARRGHKVEIAEPWSLGRNCAASTDGKLMRAAATPRFQQAYAVGR
jgi:gamma-glutamyltranspeptidase/glutathione hydrolase